MSENPPSSKRPQKAFRYFAIGACVLSIGFLAIVIASYFFPFTDDSTYENKITCINNIRQIDGAKQQWAFEHQKQKSDTPVLNDLTNYVNSNRLFVCPAGGTYTLNRVGEAPTCSIPDHKLSVVSNP